MQRMSINNKSFAFYGSLDYPSNRKMRVHHHKHQNPSDQYSTQPQSQNQNHNSYTRQVRSNPNITEKINQSTPQTRGYFENITIESPLPAGPRVKRAISSLKAQFSRWIFSICASALPRISDFLRDPLPAPALGLGVGRLTPAGETACSRARNLAFMLLR